MQLDSTRVIFGLSAGVRNFVALAMALLASLMLGAMPAAAQSITSFTSAPTSYSGSGQTITFTVTVNSGSRVASSATVTSALGATYSCPIADTVNTGVTFTCTGTYTTTAADAGTIQIQERVDVRMLSLGTPIIMTSPVLTLPLVAAPAPTVTSLSPATGPATGGTSVTITGTSFAGTTGVSFGVTPATAFTVNSSTSITATAPAGSGTVNVRVTTAGGTSAIGAGNAFTYAAATVAPAITTNPPAAVNAVAGNTVNISAAASGTPTPTVQWQVSTDLGATYTNIAGATATTLSFTATQADSGKRYRAVFTNSAGTAATTAAALNVNTLPVITQQPVGGTAAPGQGISMSAAATGSPPPTLQWLYSEDNGATFIPITTSSSFTLISPTPKTVLMKVTFTNAAGSVTSDTVTLIWTKQNQTISYTSTAPTTAAVGGATYTVSATATSGLAVAFTVDASASSVCSVSGSTVSFIGVGTCVINANQAGNTTYNAAPQVQQSFTVGQGANLITFPALSDTAFSATPPALSATASSGLAVSYASNSTGICTVSGSTISFVAGGTCSITASQAGNANYVAATPVTQTFQVTQSPNIITFPAMSNTPFTSAPPSPSATASSGLAVSYASNSTGVCTVTSAGAISFVATGTCSITASQAGNTTYAAATPVTQTFDVTPGANTITFPALTDTAFTSAPPALSATASSGLAVSYASNSAGVCTVSGGAISFVAAGTCSITASQAGNANYAAATPVTQTFAVTPGVNTITFPALADTPFTSAPPALSATASSGLAVSYASNSAGVCTVSGSAISFVAAGTCSITASQAGDANYAAATPVTRTFAVTPGVNTITFAALPNRALGSGSFTLAATSSSGLAVGFASTTAGTCSVSGTTVTLLAVGTCSITATQPGNGNFAAAQPVSQSFTVTKAASTVALTSSASTVFFGQPVTLTATVSGVSPTGTVTFTDGGSALGTVALTGNTATFTTSSLSSGSHSFTATYNGDASNDPSTSSAVTVTVNARPDPSQDPDVRSSTDSQFRQSERFASTQIDNISGRLDQLHQDNDVPGTMSMRVNQVRPQLAGNLSVDVGQNRDNLASTSLGGGKDGGPALAAGRGEGQGTAAQTVGAAGTASSAAASLAQEGPRWQVWAAGDVTFGKQQPNGQVESRFTSTGLTVGMDGSFNDNLKLGVAIGFAWDNTRIGLNGSENDATNAALSFYGSWRVAPRLYVDGIVGMGYGTIRTSRYSTTGGVFLDGERRTSQTYTALIMTYEGELGGMEFAPYLRADVIWVHLSPYSETGSPIWALAFQAADETSFSGVVGARLRIPLSGNGRWRLVTKGEYRTRLSGDYTQLIGYADLQGVQGSPYTITGTGVESSTFTGGLGLEGRLRGATVRLNYDASTMAGGNWANSFSGALIISF